MTTIDPRGILATHDDRDWEGDIRRVLEALDDDADSDSIRRMLEDLIPDPPTMADIAWDDEVHAGLCAESTDDGVVRMIGLDWENDHADHILCYLRPGAFDSLPMRSLTPLPGTRLDLTPRRHAGGWEA